TGLGSDEKEAEQGRPPHVHPNRYRASLQDPNESDGYFLVLERTLEPTLVGIFATGVTFLAFAAALAAASADCEPTLSGSLVAPGAAFRGLPSCVLEGTVFEPTD